MSKSKLTKLWIGLGVLILLTPVGLILPRLFHAGGAWGEWDAAEIREIAGYIPEGLKKLSGKWSAPVSDYAFSGWDEGIKSYIAYILSGILGVAAVVAVAYILGKILKRGER
jgi:cobalt/nickel transport protein